MPTIMDFKGTSPTIHESVYLADDVFVIGDVEIGEDANVWFGSVLRGDVSYIRIGARTNIQDMTMIHVSSTFGPTIIEDEVTVGHRVTLHGCHVERQCLIGMGAIVMDEARIGEQSIIGAGALVSPGTVIPPRVLAIGSPARVKRALTAEELAYLDKSWRNYVELKNIYQT
ncbi:MAG TPA: gamma carbonic anhydrase family protein [Pyrinomonadaceae bacterium]|nr:gamma carbonic anhydrase family protein [Pyrinomonadaceae bacterium]